jgi:hypothetical protein
MDDAGAQALADGYLAYTTGLAVEHWAVRDDAAMLDAVKA